MTRDIDQEIKQAKQEIARLEQQSARLSKRIKGQNRKSDTRRKILVGAVVLNACATDKELRNKVAKLLNNGLRRDDDRLLLSDLLSMGLSGEHQAE